MRNSTLRQLTVFETVARHLHFTRAAEELGTTQPSVSAQVKQFEDNLGVPLFEQLGKRIYLTEAGQEVYRYCCNISQHLAEAETVLDRFRGTHSGKLSLSVGRTAKYFVPQLLAAFRLRHEELFIHLEVAGHQRLLRRLADNVCDLAIMGSLPEDQDLISEPFLDDPLVLIAQHDHPLAQERALPLSRLAQEPFLMRELESETRNTAERFFAQQGVTVTASMTINSNEAIKRCVQAGLGVAVVPLHSITLELDLGRLAVIDVVGMPLQRSWYIVHRQGKRFSRIAEAFKDFMLNEAQKIIIDSTAMDSDSTPARYYQTSIANGPSSPISNRVDCKRILSK